MVGTLADSVEVIERKPLSDRLQLSNFLTEAGVVGH